MMEALEKKLDCDNVFFDAKMARLRCIAHIVHLAALKVHAVLSMPLNYTYSAVAASGWSPRLNRGLAR